ncbi:MAG: DUF11 domain-containing protein [Leptolyngbya sp. SIO1D8]|nr:DUF11 domain-containing protein [Leptolyngbya sp. SIO1D8]
MFSVTSKNNRQNFLTGNHFGLVAGLTTISTLAWTSAAVAQTRLPSQAGLDFQTSGPEQCANIGDWYTTACSTDPLPTTSTDPVHRFFINITQPELDAVGGSIVITVDDAESNGGQDEVNPQALGATPVPDPTRFTLLAPDGSVLQTQTFPSGTPDGTDFSFNPVTTPGIYTITSETGALPIFGDPTLNLNDDDNSFGIEVPFDNLLIGQFQGTFQRISGAPRDTVQLFFLVGPGTDELQLRNFDLDDRPGTATRDIEVEYGAPNTSGIGIVNGTESLNGVWNNGGDLNTGADAIPLTDITNDAGIWSLTILNYNQNNQSAVEANSVDNGVPSRIPVFDSPPTNAGNFIITPDTTLTTTIGTEVCHPFTVTNNFFTTDIINLSSSGTDPNYTIEFRDAANNPLPDTDGDGNPDTGILNPNETGSFQLCVTPQPGAPLQDVTTISATSFLDTRVRFQSGQPAPTPQTVIKTTLIETPFVLVKRITNIFRQGTALSVQGITNFNDQAGETADNRLADAFAAAGLANQPAGIFELPVGFELEPDDNVEYTLYFWNNGSVPLSQVQICDELEPPSVLNINTPFEVSPVGPLAGGLNFVSAGGQVQGRSPGAALEDFCVSAPGTFPFGPPGPTGGLGVGSGGGVTTGEFTIPTGEFGAIRFQVRIP